MKKKYLSIILIFIVMFILIMYLVTKGNPDRNSLGEGPSDEEALGEYTNLVQNKINVVNNLTQYYTARACVSKFFTTYSNSSNDSKEIYDFLNSEYTSENNINFEYLNQKFGELKNFKVEVVDMWYFTDLENINEYIMKVDIVDINTQTKKSFDIFLVTDDSTQAYNIYFDDYIIKNNFDKLNAGDAINVEFIKSVKKNKYNIFSNYNISYDDYMKEILGIIKEDLLYDKEKAYENLDEEAKAAYGSKESFYDFINANKKDIFLMSYGSYEIQSENGETHYIIYDKKDKLYVDCTISSVMKFTYKIEEL